MKEPARFAELELVAAAAEVGPAVLELRNCDRCGSTLAREIPDDDERNPEPMSEQPAPPMFTSTELGELGLAVRGRIREITSFRAVAERRRELEPESDFWTADRVQELRGRLHYVRELERKVWREHYATLWPHDAAKAATLADGLIAGLDKSDEASARATDSHLGGAT